MDTARPDAGASSRLSSVYLHGLAFLGGFGVMLLEMCAFRVLATTFGSSIYVTGVLLALVMISLSAGYYLGGRFSRRYDLGFLLWLLLGAGVYVALTGVFLSEPLLEACFALRGAFRGSMAIHAVPPAVATLLLYAGPMLALSQVSPFLIKVLTARAAQGGAEARGVGATAGNLMALSTVGSIVGTLLPSFVFIPLLGVPSTLWIFLGLLGAALVGGFALMGRHGAAGVTAAVLLVGVGAGFLRGPEGVNAPSRMGQLVFSAESLYGNVKIFRSTDEAGDTVLYYMPSRSFVHSAVYPGRPLKDQFTNSYLHLGLARGARRYLILGSALGGAVAALLEADPRAEITAVEIDPLVSDLARRFVPRIEQPRVRFVVEDARLFLREDRGAYDYIVVDVFSGEQLPAHCVTQEFFALAHARLAPGGVLQMNTNLWDFQVFTGLETSTPIVPVHHLHSALLRVGFASLFQNDYFENGHLYAFRERTSLEEVRGALARQARDEAVPADLRASMAIAALQLLPVPDTRRGLRPLSDSWVPEHALHLKGNFDGYLEALGRASLRPEWKEQVQEAGDSELRLIAARHYAQAATTHAPTYDGFNAYMAGEGGARFCSEVMAWASHGPKDLHAQLARYLHTRVVRRCGRALSEPAQTPGTAPAAQALSQYARAVRYLAANQGDSALPLLLDVLAYGS
ncbi:spermidine synthase [Hyalangium rubrum]|uniref:Fused MFS/spermidine synthase n=1 Tax=Hyalangium rubrum TaxID=3103134 RepID=A0ABU5H4A8_9BACT|nr:fused MFS/spermidine synthase [Hyalangium sp. s54d21]MDY7227622.1 fused MFS/spermidine synthase [Hyalangium sp. s54d21]